MPPPLASPSELQGGGAAPCPTPCIRACPSLVHDPYGILLHAGVPRVDNEGGGGRYEYII